MKDLKIKIDSRTALPDGYTESFIQRTSLAIEKTKLNWDSTNWLVDESKNYYKGYRYQDNKRILEVILGNIRTSFINYVNDTNNDMNEYELMNMISNWADDLTDDALSEIVNNGITYSAETDYWYKFEKTWN